jgi:hypothetical protein
MITYGLGREKARVRANFHPNFLVFRPRTSVSMNGRRVGADPLLLAALIADYRQTFYDVSASVSLPLPSSFFFPSSPIAPKSRAIRS